MGAIEDLQYDICPKCGEVHHTTGWGLIPSLNHPCAGNVHEYRMLVGSSFMRQFDDLIRSIYGHQPKRFNFQDLLHFDSFNAMPNFDTATDLEKKWYSIIRESDIRSMKRLRAYIELEEEFDAKY